MFEEEEMFRRPLTAKKKVLDDGALELRPDAPQAVTGLAMLM
jgi:hypothetical protein